MKRSVLILLVVLGFTFSTSSLMAEELSVSAGVDFVSKYVWRGFTLSDGFNSQPGVEVGFGGLSLGYWGSVNWEAEDYNIEQDLYLGYGFSMLDEALGVSLGYTYYKFPSLGEDESHEFYLGFSLDKMPLAPSLTFYLDVGDEDEGGADGQYILLSLGHDFEVSPKTTFSLSSGLGYNNELFIDEKGLADFTFSAGFSWKVSERASFGLSGTYSTVVDSDVESAMGADDEFYGALHVSVS